VRAWHMMGYTNTLEESIELLVLAPNPLGWQ
jgi:hypothetical protein